MNFVTLTYALALSASCVFFVRFGSFQKKILCFVACMFISLIPFIYGLSLTQWIDSFCGEPSVFLLFLSLSVCFISFYAPKEIVLPVCSKIFIVILGFVLFLGNLNLLWGFDIYSLDFCYQLIIVLGILFFAFMLDAYLGILYFISLFVYAISPYGNIFSYLIDIVVWLYALICLVLGSFTKKQRGSFERSNLA